MHGHQDQPGKLAACLETDSRLFTVAREIETALNIDTAFHAPKNLVDTLLFLLPDLEKNSVKASLWLEAIKAIHASATAQRWRKTAGTGPDKNPLYRSFHSYPLPAFLLQEAPGSATAQVKGIKLLFLYALLTRRSVRHEEHGLTYHANDLRIATRAKANRPELLNSLPAYQDSFSNYHQLAKQAVSVLLKQHANLPLFESMRILLEMLPTRVKSVTKPVKTRQQSFHTRLSVPEEDQTPARLISSIQVDTDSSFQDEPPEFIDLFSIKPYSELDDDLSLLNPQLLDEFLADSQARRSEYWLRRHHRLVPTDWGRLTFVERKHLVAAIKNGISSDILEERTVAGLAGCMYVTGMGLEAVLQSYTGPEQTFDTDGHYIRKILLPDACFMPDETQTHDLLPLAENLRLLLPEPIRSWISKLCSDEPKSLGESLGVSLDDAKLELKNFLDSVRNRVLSRIRLERISTSLALEVTLSYQNPLITYLLAATETQAPPKLAYYAAYPAQDIERMYQEVSEGMMQP